MRYAGDVRRAAYWYFKLWPRTRHYDVADLIQAGNIAVMDVATRRPDKYEYRPYVRGAIRFGILGEIRKRIPKIREVQLVRSYEGEEHIPIVDLLPAFDEGLSRVEHLDMLYHHISNTFSGREAQALMNLVGKCETIFDLNLSDTPSTDKADKTRVVTKMDLDDDEMVVYGQVLLRAVNTFPRDYVNGQRERARKYITFLLDALDISPQDFALCDQRRTILCKYGLDSFYQRVYHCKMAELFADVFPGLEPHQVRARNRWRGRQGLLNAYNAVGWLARTTGKRPPDLARKDFAEHKLLGALKVWFEDSYQRAVEFRFPGTYSSYAKEVMALWSALGASS